MDTSCCRGSRQCLLVNAESGSGGAGRQQVVVVSIEVRAQSFGERFEVGISQFGEQG
jgi:hypothetical protein